MNWLTILAFVLGAGLGYLVFFFKYKHRDIVSELRTNLKEANKEVHSLNQEMEEYMQQNILLKNKMWDFLEKNDDLSKVVWELSKYYYHIKKASEKTEELTKYLQQPDPDIEEKMQIYMVASQDIANEETEEKKTNKSFF